MMIEIVKKYNAKMVGALLQNKKHTWTRHGQHGFFERLNAWTI